MMDQQHFDTFIFRVQTLLRRHRIFVYTGLGVGGGFGK